MPGFFLYSSNRQEKLADRLAALCAAAPLPPFESEIILCENKGMARWVSLSLAERLGVFAGAQFPYPYRFIWETFGKAFPGVLKEEDSPFNTAVMTWRILNVLQRFLKHPVFQPVKRYLDGDETGLKRYQLAGRLAHLFDQYLDYRPQMIVDQWEKGRPGGEDSPEAQWQALLWKALLEGTDQLHRARLFLNFFARVKQGGIGPAGLPPRISVIGIPFLPPVHLDFLRALSQVIDVHFFLLNPSRQYWGDLKKKSAPPKGTAETFLTSAGVLGRDFQEQLVNINEKFEEELFEPPSGRGMLGGLQRELLDLSLPGKAELSSEDRSIELNACHTPMREVEVLYDRLLESFEKLPGLLPHQIVVMSPDIDLYAPYIRAVFGGALGGRPAIPFRLSDRPLRAEGEMLDFFVALLTLAGGRFEAAKVISLLECPAVLEKFNLPLESVETLAGWVEEAGIRWGIDGDFKRTQQLPATEHNTWRAGLRRLLLGYALPDKEGLLFAGIAPLDLVEGDSGETLGRFLDFLEALFESLPPLSQPRSPADWAAALRGLADRFFAEERHGSQEMEFIRGFCDGFSATARRAGFEGTLSLPVVLHIVENAAGDSASAGGYLSQGITFCSLTPMRSIPFRIVCLMGMDQGKFPREAKKPGFDLVRAARRRLPGDRTEELDDKYLFLEAILSARDALIISYLGRSEVDNLPLEPSLLVRDLWDHLQERYAGRPLTVVHRLQGSHPDYFIKGGTRISFSVNDFKAAAARLGARPASGAAHPGGGPSPVFALEPLPAPDPPVGRIRLEALAAFFSHPAKYFLNERLRIFFPKAEPPLSGSEPFRSQGLEKYQIMGKLLRRPGGFDGAQSRGLLPHGVLGRIEFDAFRRTADALLAFLPKAVGEAAVPAPVRISIPPFEIEGELNASPAGQLFCRPALIKPKDLIPAWIHHLAFSCTLGGKSEAPTYLGGLKGEKPDLMVFRRVENPDGILREMSERYVQGLCIPLPFFPAASKAYAENAAGSTRMGLRQAHQVFYGEGGDAGDSGEGGDPYLDLCFGGRDPLDGEFESLALWFYGPLFAAVGAL